MMLTDDQLLERIEAFLDRTGMAPSRFGREAMSEGQLIASLRKGRSLSLSNVNKVLAFIAENDVSPDEENGPTGGPDTASTGEADKMSGQAAA